MSVLDLLPQEPAYTNLDLPPSHDEILKASRKLRDTSPGASSGLHARLWRALMETPEGFICIRPGVCHQFLADGACPVRVGNRTVEDPAKEGRSQRPGKLQGFHDAGGGIQDGRLHTPYSLKTDQGGWQARPRTSTWLHGRSWALRWHRHFAADDQEAP